ncbi:MAG: hypothetical protein ONB48_08145 [candidate division KSB1 bacterium]|nr:hypothetical protein [candidate division KSB1 bacterium]MDZ7285618.1 hypothetical protein [candidate division KSB1 bacterium]MDZ7298650.1 hypothetical protein [candidate division KSB1 bacterium]MDZ7307490.1 hypothetical protein [candidate division KSB1 bacterium]MDZ7349515.1 hypothetical protein [candidate division KSB1 bacterium]
MLTPPDQILTGVKQIAIADFNVSSSFGEDEAPGRKNTLDKILGAVEKGAAAERNKARFNDAGRKLSDLMTAALVKKDRGIGAVSTGFLGLGSKEGRSFQTGAYTNIFRVVERSQIQQVMNELQLAQTGLVDESSAAQVGRVLGVDAIIMGSVNVAYQSRWLQEEREKDKKKYQVNCEKRNANVSASIRIIKVETGEVIGTHDSQNKQEKKKCEGEYGDLPLPETMVDQCLEKVADELVDYFAPEFVLQKLKFEYDMGDEYKRQTETAKRAIKDYDLDTAYLQFAAIVEQDPYNHAANFNLGVLHEAVGNYKKAQEKYNFAFSLKSDEGRYRDAQKRLAKQMTFWDQLNTLGIVLAEHEFNTNAAQLASATVTKVVTKGSTSTRHEIKTEPNAASATLVRVPGGIELELLEASKEWFKVKLPDGKQGYISASLAQVRK